MNMTSITRLLLATDFSEWAHKAEISASALAASWRAQLTVITVVEVQPGMDPEHPVHKMYVADRLREASARLADFEKKNHSQDSVLTTRISSGIASEEVIAAATGDEADLIIIGARGTSDLPHVILGSTAERVIRMAPCPVLVVTTGTGKGQTDRELSIQRILVPVDFSDCSLEAVDYATVLAGQAKASIHLLHVLEPSYLSPDCMIEPPEEHDARCKEAQMRLGALSEKVVKTGIAVQQNLRGGAPVEVIREEAQRVSSDLIVMGTHGRGGVSQFWAGSVTEGVLKRGGRPVLAVRNPAFQHRHNRER